MNTTDPSTALRQDQLRLRRETLLDSFGPNKQVMVLCRFLEQEIHVLGTLIKHPSCYSVNVRVNGAQLTVSFTAEDVIEIHSETTRPHIRLYTP